MITVAPEHYHVIDIVKYIRLLYEVKVISFFDCFLPMFIKLRIDFIINAYTFRAAHF